ncbi:ABC-F family ATP-binding cassette domain-containing protein [Magnetospirillum sulfuroxidans]|uniref:ABC-F family ATP-binding cassette domain-containing protein n=1 Tax=Magnetospirillum sulfuroxidans TaxID=611300 RepID=A0ABS5IFE3_9PROT|nr:ABC-F family ATP-binding cassette domain-containing protein [Magnetospirillum sulfuroxidans]MBR9973119.1 ABC-F family ATP-binding cassette domain-containing protein [Magnetospirillum sulfuroxidans]
MLHINDLVFRFGGRVLFDQASVHIPAGARIGLVGRNGAGKSTLFKLILNELAADGGDISIRPRARTGCVAQEAPEGETSLLDCVLAADIERSQLLAEAEHSHDPHRLAEVHERLNAIDAHSAPSRAASILAGLGFDAVQQARPVSSYSGGWRMRVALAAVLFIRPDLLLLDEPTNHLDLEATLWLQSYLGSYPGTLLVISHDRELLNEVCNRIVHLERTKLVSYGGNYDDFERTRREKMDLAAKAQVKQLEQRRKIQSFIDRFRAKATKARQAQSRIKMLERMGPPISVIEDRSISFDFPDPDALSPPIIAIDNGIAGYGDKTVLADLNIRVDMDDRIALLGANGNGKSTLSKVLSGRLKLLSGDMHRPAKLRIGYFAQHQTDELDLGRTPYDHMLDLMKAAPESKVRAQLGRFGFEQDRADVKVENLSGGEKARLLFALMSRDAPHLMILDEPTNHLDIDSREALVAALNAYEGAVVLVSHDPHLVELVADRLWLVADGKVAPFDGDLADYRKFLLDQARDARRGGGGGGERPSAATRKNDRRAAAEARAQTAPLRKKVQDAEKRLEKLNQDKTKLAAKLADPKLYSGPGETVTALQKELANLEREIADTESLWLEVHEQLEAATASA